MAQPTHGISEKQISQSLLDLIESGKPTDYATIVYFNSTNPTTATIFDNVNPPVTNDPLLEGNVANLYIGTDNSTWVYNGTNYSTKVVPASSNFYINGTNTDAGNNKTSAISRTGSISVGPEEPIAIYGEGTVVGVYGFCDSGGEAGVRGDGVDTGGVWGSSDNNFGVFGNSDSGIGVQGYSNSSVAGDFGIGALNTGKIATFKKGNTEVASISGQGNFVGGTFNGYVPENQANKQDSLSTDGTATKFPTVDAVNVFKTATNNSLSTLSADLLSKLPKGTYTGTASDLETSILAISTGVQGVAITPTSTPTGTGVASWLVAESGTYTNFGGVILPVNHIGFIIRSASDVYSITSTELDLSDYVKFKEENVTITATDIDVANALAVTSTSFSSTMVRSISKLERIKSINARTYTASQHILFWIQQDTVDLDLYTVISSLRYTADFTIERSDFPANATHYLIRGITVISTGMTVIEFVDNNKVVDILNEASDVDRNYDRNILETSFTKTSVVDITRYEANKTIEPLQGRKKNTTSGYLSDFSKITLNTKYHIDFCSVCFMFDYYKNYIGNANITESNSKVTITDDRCYYVRISVPSPVMQMVVDELRVKTPVGKIPPVYKGYYEKLPKKDYKMPIQGFGDSIIARHWIGKTNEIIGNQGTYFSYGGTTSSFVRSKFIELYENTNNTTIIFGNHNNITETQTIINDFRRIVRHRGDSNFLIVSSPSGTYGNNQGTIDFVNNSKIIEDKLESIYGQRFLNMRKAIVNGGYDYGNVKLTAGFTQPAVNSNVDIYVDNIPFINFDNPESGMTGLPALNLIKIGKDGLYDEYERISTTITTGNNGYITAKLISNPRIATGNSVENLNLTAIPAGTSIPIPYTVDLEVFKSIDKYLEDTFETTGSSFREDGVHPSPYGGKCMGEIIAYRLSALNFIQK